jgi:hypothetical protein
MVQLLTLKTVYPVLKTVRFAAQKRTLRRVFGAMAFLCKHFVDRHLKLW